MKTEITWFIIIKNYKKFQINVLLKFSTYNMKKSIFTIIVTFGYFFILRILKCTAYKSHDPSVYKV